MRRRSCVAPARPEMRPTVHCRDVRRLTHFEMKAPSQTPILAPSTAAQKDQLGGTLLAQHQPTKKTTGD
jgi:hypothetical protein